MGHATPNANTSGIIMSLLKYFEIISKEAWEKEYSQKVKIPKKKYGKTLPILKALFTKLNGGTFNDTVVMDLDTEVVVKLNNYDKKLIGILVDLGYTVSKETYMTGKAVNEKGKEVNILDVLSGFNSKIKTKKQMEDIYERTNNPAIGKQLKAIEKLDEEDLIHNEQINVRMLSIYNTNKAGKYKIVFTMDPRAIASQSTQVGWTSCMNLKGGMYRGKVGPSIGEGVFIAYLTKAGDELTLDNPTARVLIKPLKSPVGEIVWDVDAVYGTPIKGFTTQVRKIAKQYSSKVAGMYELPETVYHDKGKHSAIVGNLKNFSRDELIKFIHHNSDSPKLRQLIKVTKDPEILEYIIDASGEYIKEIENPSEKLQLIAVEDSGLYLQYIKNPTRKVIIAALEDDGHALKYVKNPDIGMQLAAVRTNGMALQYIKDPDNRVANAAISERGDAIQFIEWPTVQQQKMAIHDGIHNIKYIKNPDEEALAYMIKENSSAIDYIPEKYMNDRLKMIAIQSDTGIYDHMNNPPEEVKWYIAKNEPEQFWGHNRSRTHSATPEIKAWLKKNRPATYKEIYEDD